MTIAALPPINMTTIAKTISDQLGHRALYMMGAKNLVGSDEGRFLQFRIMRNKTSANVIKITLNSLDTYDVEFISVRGTSYKIKELRESVYADSLHRVIEDVTGLRLSL